MQNIKYFFCNLIFIPSARRILQKLTFKNDTLVVVIVTGG